MELLQMLQRVELFEGLSDVELEEVSKILVEKRLQEGEIIARQGTPGDEFFLITEGFAEISIADGKRTAGEVVVNLGSGQVIGEMAIIDQGPRSATIRAISDPTVIQVAHRDDFERLCEENNRIGYIIMRNIAADLSFKLRHRHLSR